MRRTYARADYLKPGNRTMRLVPTSVRIPQESLSTLPTTRQSGWLRVLRPRTLTDTDLPAEGSRWAESSARVHPKRVLEEISNRSLRLKNKRLLRRMEIRKGALVAPFSRWECFHSTGVSSEIKAATVCDIRRLIVCF